MILNYCKWADRRILQVGALLGTLLGPVVSVTTVAAHGNEHLAAGDSSAASAPASGAAGDTAALLEVRTRVMAFTDALDSVYKTIAGTYYGIEPILREGCYDCHSGQTRYPWYYKIPGVRGMIDNDIAEARKHLDMDKGFPFGGHASQESQLAEIREEIASGGMPLLWYKWLHWGAAPNDAERDSVFAWIDSSIVAIQGVMKAFGVEPPDESAPVVYICPMDPEVVSSKPGTCPKCGMDLEELTRGGEQH